MVEEGNPAPDFTLTSDSGGQVALESLRGQPVVLYFYSKDDTPRKYFRSRACVCAEVLYVPQIELR